MMSAVGSRRWSDSPNARTGVLWSMTRFQPSTRGRAARRVFALAAIIALALLVRALGFEYVFVGDEIVFPPADPQYHLRRALYTLSRFPDVLLFDLYINHPGGAPVPWPPLFDFTLGGIGWLLGGATRDLERVAAWSGPACAAIAVVPIYLSGTRLASRAVGFVAAFFFAMLPISVVYTRIGNADHHAAVAMIGAWLLYTMLALVDPTASRRRMICLALLLFVVRSAMLLTWHGSLLYLAPAEGLLLLAGIVTGRPALLAAQAASAAATLCIIAMFLGLSPMPLGGAYSSIALSRLHVLALVAVVVASGGLLVGVRLGAAATPMRRLAWSLAAGLAFIGVLIVLPGPREGLTYAFQFLTLGDEVGAITGEQTPLFAVGGRLLGPPATHSWGLFAYVLPGVALAGLIAGRLLPGPPGARAAGWTLAGWALFFCTLASLQRRYGNDAAPAASLAFALLLVAASERGIAVVMPRSGLAVRRTSSVLLAMVLVVLFLTPAVAAVYAPRGRASFAALGSEGRSSPGALTSVAYTLHRFAGEVRDATPETSGYLEGSAGPEYGVIAHANLGHALQYRGRRPTATDPFWWYIGRENWDRSFAFLDATREREALELAHALDARFVVTMPGLGANTVVGRLHHADGAGRGGRRPLTHFRLVTEAPRGGLSIGALFGDAGLGDGAARAVPYKLFEIVSGAVIEVSAEPGTTGTASVEVRTPTGRRFDYRRSGRAGPDGLLRLRVVYPTQSVEPPPSGLTGRRARAVASYTLRVGGVVESVDVSEQQIQRGDTLRVATRSDDTAPAPVAPLSPP